MGQPARGMYVVASTTDVSSLAQDVFTRQAIPEATGHTLSPRTLPGVSITSELSSTVVGAALPPNLAFSAPDDVLTKSQKANVLNARA